MWLVLGMMLGSVVVCFIAMERYLERVHRWAKEAPRCWECRYQLAQDWASVTQMSEVCPECGFPTAESRRLWDQWKPINFLSRAFRGFIRRVVNFYYWCKGKRIW